MPCWDRVCWRSEDLSPLHRAPGGTPHTVGAVAPAGHRAAGPLGLWGDAVHPGDFIEPSEEAAPPPKRGTSWARRCPGEGKGCLVSAWGLSLSHFPWHQCSPALESPGDPEGCQVQTVMRGHHPGPWDVLSSGSQHGMSGSIWRHYWLLQFRFSTGISCVQARDTDKYPTIHSPASPQKHPASTLGN